MEIVTWESLSIWLCTGQANAVMSSLMSIAPKKAVMAETGEKVDADEVKLNPLRPVKLYPLMEL